MNEAETRLNLIDPALKAAGWGVVEGSRIRAEYPITLGRLEGAGKRGKPMTADYVLEYRLEFHHHHDLGKRLHGAHPRPDAGHPRPW